MTLQWYTSNFQDTNLIPSNIKDGVDIFGVEGTFEGSWSWSMWDVLQLELTGWQINWPLNYIKIWNLFIFGWAWVYDFDSNKWEWGVTSDIDTRTKIMNLLWYTNIVDYFEWPTTPDVNINRYWIWSVSNNWWYKRITWNPGKYLYAMILS